MGFATVRTFIDSLIQRPHKPSGCFAAYSLALACVGVAFFLRLFLGVLDHEASPFTTFYPAILFAALWGGSRAGIFAIVGSGIFAWWAFMDPRFTFVAPLTFGRQLALVIFAISSLLIVVGADYCRRLAQSLRDAEELRDLAVKELSHRLKNKVATIQSIIAFQLRGNEASRDSILQRLGALSSTDTLIEAAQGQGAFLRDIVTVELAPYDVSRVTMSGEQVFLAPKFALVFGLLIHELATNAAKYGALSVHSGQVSIQWTLVETNLAIEWRETGRPIVAAPSHAGFGTRLLSRALGQFGGSAELNFDPSGLICTMNVSIPADSLPSTRSAVSLQMLQRA